MLMDHPEVRAGRLEIGALTAHANAGQQVVEVLPHLVELHDRVFHETSIETLRGHDIVVLGLPHGHSAQIARQLPESTLVIDLGADFRLIHAADWERYYGSAHAGTWPYGLPEYPGQRAKLATTSRIAVPGCFPTGATVALAPTVQSGLVDGPIAITSITGTSGAGKAAKVPMLHAEVHGSAKAYNVAIHRHTPEIKQNLQALSDSPLTVAFTPVLAPMARGILTVATVATTASAAQLRSVYDAAYGDEPFIHLLPAGAQPITASVLGSNSIHIGIEVDEATGLAVITSAIDNLTKGTAGGAIQSMNIALGFDETAGLPRNGLAP